MFSLDKDKAEEFINHSQKDDLDYIKKSAEAFNNNLKQIREKCNFKCSTCNKKLKEICDGLTDTNDTK